MWVKASRETAYHKCINVHVHQTTAERGKRREAGDVTVPGPGCSCVSCVRRSGSACSDTVWPVGSGCPSDLHSFVDDAVPPPEGLYQEKLYYLHDITDFSGVRWLSGQGVGASNQKVTGWNPGHDKNEVVSLGKPLHPTCLGGECPCTYCKSLWIRASAKCKCGAFTQAAAISFSGRPGYCF